MIILPQPLVALIFLEETRECAFDLTLDDPLLRHVFFESRINYSIEEHHHSFVGEAVCKRWGIDSYREYLLNKTCTYFTTVL